jgi:hypothetical protein
VARKLVGKLAVVAGGTTGIDLASANSMSDCQDELSDMIEQPQAHCTRSSCLTGPSCVRRYRHTVRKLDPKRGAGTRGSRKAVNPARHRKLGQPTSLCAAHAIQPDIPTHS